MSAVREFTGDGEAVVVNSINPMRLQGQKTTAFEVVEELGRMPDFHALPVGNAGNISAIGWGIGKMPKKQAENLRPCWVIRLKELRRL